MATRLGHLLSEIHYCYLCFEWVIGEDWEPHCQAHLDAFTSKRCGTVTYCHTLVRPGYCPFCVRNTSLSAFDRLKTWSRDHKLWLHVKDDHLADCLWPLVCPDPRCGTTHGDSISFQYHLIDVHKFSRSRPTKGTSSTSEHSADRITSVDSRRRKRPDNSVILGWTRPQSLVSMAIGQEERLPYRPPKRNKQSRPAPTICPQVIMVDENMPQADRCEVESVTLFPPSPLSIEDDDQCHDLECGQSPLYQTTRNGAIYPPKQADSDDSSNWDVPFELYLRSPSLSPPPDRATIELSKATLVDVGSGCGGTVPSTNPSGDPALEYGLEGEMARNPDPCCATGGPRIRLRVSRPRITLRVKLQDTSRRRNNGHRGKKKQKKVERNGQRRWAGTR